jgi:hypothetical protein
MEGVAVVGRITDKPPRECACPRRLRHATIASGRRPWVRVGVRIGVRHRVRVRPQDAVARCPEARTCRSSHAARLTAADRTPACVRSRLTAGVLGRGRPGYSPLFSDSRRRSALWEFELSPQRPSRAFGATGRRRGRGWWRVRGGRRPGRGGPWPSARQLRRRRLRRPNAAVGFSSSVIVTSAAASLAGSPPCWPFMPCQTAIVDAVRSA